MSILIGMGCLAILISLILLVVGGIGHSNVSIRYYGLGVFGQAWFVVLLLGFVIIMMDVYLTYYDIYFN